MTARLRAPDTSAVSIAAPAFWWNRGRCTPPDGQVLQAVILSIDAALADDSGEQGRHLGELVWSLHCEGVRVAVVTEKCGPAAYRAVRDLLGDGAVEVLVTGDEAVTFTSACKRAVAELGVEQTAALIVADAVGETSVRHCRELHRAWARAGCRALSA